MNKQASPLPLAVGQKKTVSPVSMAKKVASDIPQNSCTETPQAIPFNISLYPNLTPPPPSPTRPPASIHVMAQNSVTTGPPLSEVGPGPVTKPIGCILGAPVCASREDDRPQMYSESQATS